MAEDIHDAVPSWSGYNYQGEIAIYVALCKIIDCKIKNIDISIYKMELEKVEDFSIIRTVNANNVYETIHQVKATNSTSLFKYKEACEDVLSKLKGEYCECLGYLHVRQNIIIDELSGDTEINDWLKTLKKVVKKNAPVEKDIKKLNEVLEDVKLNFSEKKEALKKRFMHIYESDDLCVDNLIDKQLENSKQKLKEYQARFDDSLYCKLNLYKYDAVNYCPLNEIDSKIENKISEYLGLCFPNKSTKDNKNHVKNLYMRLRYIIQENVMRRHNGEENSEYINLSAMKEILLLEVDFALDDEFYLMLIKKQIVKALEVHTETCLNSRKNDDCETCENINKCSTKYLINKILLMDYKQILCIAKACLPHKQLINACEDANCFANDIEWKHVAMNMSKIGHFPNEGDDRLIYGDDGSLNVLTGIHDAGISFDDYKGDICKKIYNNPEMHLMKYSYNKFISKDLHVDSINEAIGIYYDSVNSAVDENNIYKGNNMGIITAEKYMESMNKEIL